MATYMPRSHSPRTSNRTSPPLLVQLPPPTTPVHSPHHSVTSSVSSRTPVHVLSIHEYRRQQNTPISPAGTPSGKTLRRIAAAPALNGLERAPSVTQTARSASHLSLRPLYSSQSALHLNSHKSTISAHLVPDHILRSQSAEPRTQGGSISSILITSSSGKTRHFNSRKRLPKPPRNADSRRPLPLAIVKSYAPLRPQLPVNPDFSRESSRSSGAPTTPTPSTFSLSRFPLPPHLLDPSFSPPHHDLESARLDALNYAKTAPATPPATPAIIHYRGASFDLVNPHDSLLLHDIVTPSRDFGSSEYLLVPTSEGALIESAEMAPKRALYGDISSAHAGILRRADDSFSSSNLDLPLPPTPAAVSPNSSTYTSPLYSPESHYAPSPLAVSKAQNDSRFSLKHLTRSLTKRLGKTPEKQHAQELDEFRNREVSIASASMDGDYPRPLNETYVAAPQPTYHPIGPVSPITPTSSTLPREPSCEQEEDNEVEMPRKHSMQRHDTEPLASMFPEDLSTHMGRVHDPRESMSEGYLLSRPYYDDLDSIYPSSSIYTGDDHRKSNYQQSLTGIRQSNPFLHYSEMDATNYATEYHHDSLYQYTDRSHRGRKAPAPKTYHPEGSRGDGQADTISKIIEQYDPNTSEHSTHSYQSQHNAEGHEDVRFAQLPQVDRPEQAELASDLSQFEFGLYHNKEDFDDDDIAKPVKPVLSQRPTIARDVGLPPRAPAPLAPPFQYDVTPLGFPRPEISEMFSNRSSYSYGDTRNLLQIPHTDLSIPPIVGQHLQTSSSYSQPEAKTLETSSSYSQGLQTPSPQTPQEALDHAERIFEHATSEHHPRKGSIPAIWAQRSSGSLLMNKKLSDSLVEEDQHNEDPAAADENDGDWESVAGDGRGVRESLGSIADYSSSEGTRNSLGLVSQGSLPSWTNHHSRGLSAYSHPSPIRAHQHPFSSSPPHMQPLTSIGTAHEVPEPSLSSNPPGSADLSARPPSNHTDDIFGQCGIEEPRVFTPWADPYAFSDKETQELLASGPNDKIMFDTERRSIAGPYHSDLQNGRSGVALMSSSPVSVFDSVVGLERENTFDKLCVLGPKGNLTGTPRGTGMHETGSSVADNSSPGPTLSSSGGRNSFRSTDYPGFYASPYAVTGSVTQIRQTLPPLELEQSRTPSQMTLFPKESETEPLQEDSSPPGPGRRDSLRGSTTLQRAQRRVSRTAVPGQTKLREMILAPEISRKMLSSQDTTFSRALDGSGRPSTSNTTTPLRPQLSVETVPAVRAKIAHHHSPHLLCPERAASPEDEERRRKLSWAILAVFCLLPPCIILYRVWGDSIIVSVSKGHLGYCTPKSKKVALIAGIAVNVGIATVIVVAILVAHALGAT